MADPSAPDLQVALDELYGADPTEFVASRKRLAGALRKAGDKEAAEQLEGARRPTKAAAALNRVARVHADLVGAFVDSSRALREASDLRTAMREQRGAFEALAGAASTDVSDAVRNEINATLHTVAADDALLDRLRAGRLVKAESGEAGFPDALAASPVRRAAKKTDDAQAARAEAEAAARARELDTARGELDAANARVEALERRVRTLTDELDDVRGELRAAKRTATAARRAVDRLEESTHG